MFINNKNTISNKGRLLTIVVFFILGIGVFLQTCNANDKFEFALIGDVPYNVLPGETFEPFDNLINEVNSNDKIKWVLHAGDIKSGSTECSDEMFMDRLTRYNQFNYPVVLTLGDNEWTDCHRIKAGEYQPLERLAKLREIFFANPDITIGGEIMEVETQASVSGFEEFPENVLWTEENIVFATMHIVGSENGLKPFDPDSSAIRTQDDDDEVVRRTNAALAWMNTAFEKAKDMDSPGIFLMIHANPGLERGEPNRNGFEEFLTALESYIQEFGKPVVLAHGDSHYFRVDKPALVENNFIANFTRVETFGSANVHWARVIVDLKNPEIFTIQEEIVDGKVVDNINEKNGNKDKRGRDRISIDIDKDIDIDFDDINVDIDINRN